MMAARDAYRVRVALDSEQERVDRYRPTRAGIINLWDYRDEEFVFADGRLVLRGPNGSGKTKALEVLFPFVLDGRIEPRRLNPFASAERTMKSNLLYRGQESAYSYVWLEFGRGHDAVTVGVGLRAQRHQDKVTRWYFVADGRAGVDFSLLGPDDRPLTKKQLGAELGAAAITEGPAEHRAAVDARLFGFGSRRFEQMLNLVLTLRRPQLAKNLDPKGLSATLADGLRPLDDELINEAARSFDDMESVQRTLDGLVKADEAASAFLTSYTTYLRAHARAASDVLTARLTSVRDARNALMQARHTHEEALRGKRDAEQALTHTEGTLADHQSRLESLKHSAAYESKEQLDKLAELVEKLGHAARSARAQAGKAAAAGEARTAEAQRAREQRDDAQQSVRRTAAALAEAAADGGIGWDATDAEADTGFLDRVGARATAREQDVRAVREALAAKADAVRARAHHQASFDKAQQATAQSERGAAEAYTALEQARGALRDAVGAWWQRYRPQLEELGTGDVSETLLETVDVLGAQEAPSLRERFAALSAEPIRTAERSLHELEHRRGLAQDGRAQLREQRERVASERDDAPPSFAARTAARAQRSGAPLWQLVRFADQLTEEDAAGLEAALHAANLLDAWVPAADTAANAAVRGGESEGFLLPMRTEARPSGRTLSDVLVAEDDTPVAVDRIDAVLASVAVVGNGVPDAASTGTTVSSEGRFAQGVQLGAHGKSAAEYIGATARARRRKARLADLDRQLAESDEWLEELARRVTATQVLVDGARAAQEQLPSTGQLMGALNAHAEAVVELRLHRGAEDTARGELDSAVALVADRERRLTSTAAAHAIQTEESAVDTIAEAIARFRSTGGDLVAVRRAAEGREQAVRDAAVRREEAAAAADDAENEAAEAEGEHIAQEAELAGLRASVGADADQVDADMTTARRNIADSQQRLKSVRTAHTEAAESAAGAASAVSGALATLTTAITEAQADARRLAPYARRDILDVLNVSEGLSWPASTQEWHAPDELVEDLRSRLDSDDQASIEPLPAEVARLHAAISEVTGELRPTEASLKAGRSRVSGALGQLQAQLAEAGHDYRPEWEPEDEVIVVRVADEQGSSSIGDFARRITAARKDQELLLTESERRILEDALLGRLAQQIHERTIDARDLIGRMNTEMRSRRMSSGATIGVQWSLADWLDDEQRAVCRLTDLDAARLAPDDLAKMRTHFASRIKMERARTPDRSYADLLAEVLDYRRWRTFAFSLVGADGTEERLTQSRHSTLSGGEQSVSLHLPLFAAAHVTLSSARPDCPRLIALDEAFAGVDDPGRTELLGLTTQFDLDLFMTGYDLWACYDTVPGCAHHDLSHSTVEHTLSSLLLVWDGGTLLADHSHEDLAATLGSPRTRRRPGDADVSLLDQE